MTGQLPLSSYLHGIQTEVCNRYAGGWSICPGCAPIGYTCTADPLQLRVLPSSSPGPSHVLAEYRARIQESRCKQCIFFLLLTAINETLPADQVPVWMAKPNDNLDGDTPLACIDRGQYERVFDALWLLSEMGPCS